MTDLPGGEGAAVVAELTAAVLPRPTGGPVATRGYSRLKNFVRGEEMKIVLYCDTYPGQPLEYFTASASPGTKFPTWKRYKLEFEIPDSHDPDAAPPVVVTEEKK